MGGVNIRLAGPNCTLNQIHGQIRGQLPGYPPSIGIKFGSLSTDSIGFNIINVCISDNEASAIEFTDRDAGGSSITLNVYSSSGDLMAGTPNSNSHVKIDANGFVGSPFRLDSWRQISRISIPATGNIRWNFPIKFRENRSVTFSTVSPEGELSKSLWISDLSDTSIGANF